MKRINTVELIVKEILEKEPAARDDDMYLYYLFCTKYGFLVDSNLYTIFKSKEYRNNVGLSPYHTVARARRKLQADHSELSASAEVQEARINETGEYIGYSINDSYKPALKKYIDKED